MSLFKDLLQSDLSTFFNTNEMAEEHKINGVSMVIVPDKEKLEQYMQVAGISSDSVAYSVPLSVFGKIPKVGEYQSFNGKDMIIADASNEGGVLQIVITGYSSGI